jgi:hypothetical protein
MEFMTKKSTMTVSPGGKLDCLPKCQTSELLIWGEGKGKGKGRNLRRLKGKMIYGSFVGRCQHHETK